MSDRINIDDNIVSEDRKRQLRKEHDLKYELYQLRQRVDELEQQEVEHRKCLDQMDKTIMMQFALINALCDLTKSLAEDVARLSALMKEDKNE